MGLFDSIESDAAIKIRSELKGNESPPGVAVRLRQNLTHQRRRRRCTVAHVAGAKAPLR